MNLDTPAGDFAPDALDMDITLAGLPATNISFIVPLVCFIVVALYGHKAYVRQNIMHVLE